ncbi:DUF3742 family protein [Alcanivorax hongdengensis]|uniref:DUF3742 family protein n=1 Tax=Alcanivorax hongdengensis TaxID=519051 RepID=UPI00058BAD26|nr:DUF3742 family protein [Alcanivorax hongdengensis]
MKAAPTVKKSERAGRWLGRVWRGVAHREARAVDWLAEQGVPARAGWLLFWLIKILVVGLLLYVAFWLALLAVIVIASAWLAQNLDPESERQPELRDGHSGVGLYDKDDWRIDMGDPDEP